MNVLDLFCGACGGWTLGLGRAGMRTVAGVESDPWRRAAYARNFPGVPVYPDVRLLGAERLRSDGVPAIDVVAGSPPCQDASQANAKGKGVDGPRTGLFFEAIRIVGECRPRWVLFENVPGLRARGYDRIHAALEALGYAVRPLVVGAWHAGAPHRRNRVWIIADAPVMLRSAVARHQSDGLAGGVVADAPRQRWWGGPDIAQPEFKGGTIAELRRWPNWNGGPPDLGGMDARLPKGMAQRLLSAYGDSVVPVIPELIGRAIIEWEHRP